MAWKRGKRLSPIPEQQASGEVASIYSEIRAGLGISFVPMAYQLLASEPTFLREHWRAVASLLDTKAFRGCTDRLRADAYTRVHSYFKVPDLQRQLDDLRFSDGAKEELSYVVDLFLYLNPALLLIFAVQAQAFEGPVGSAETKREPPNRIAFHHVPCFAEEDAAPASTRRSFDEARQITGIPVLSSDVRAFARWPEFLDLYWGTVRSVVRSPIFSECQRAIEDTAAALSRELPGPIELTFNQLAEAGMAEDEISAVVKTIDQMVHGFALLSLNISVAKIGLERGNLSHAERVA